MKNFDFDDFLKQVLTYLIFAVILTFFVCVTIGTYFSSKEDYQQYVKHRQEVVLNAQEIEIRSLQTD